MRFETAKIKDLISEISMGPFGSNIKVECFVDSGIPVLNGSNLDGYVLKEDAFRYVTEEKADSLGKANARRGDVVITHRGTLGQIVFIPKTSLHDRYVISQSQFRVKCNKRILPEYLVYYFHTRKGQHKLLSNASQVGVPALARASTTFQDIEIEIPHINDQEKIVWILETIRKKGATNNAINENLTQQAYALYKSIISNSTSSAQLSDYITIKHGFAFKGEFITTESNSVVLVTPGNFRIGGGFQENKCKYFTAAYSDEYVLRPNDLIVTMTDLSKDADTLGYSALVPDNPDRTYLHNQRIGLVQFRDDRLNKDYVYWFLRSYDYHMQIVGSASGSTVKHTSPGRILEQMIPIPDANDIGKILLMEIIDKTIAKNDLESNKLASIRDGLLPRLMSGELDVSEIDL